LSTAAFDADDNLDIGRNLNWKQYKRFRVVDIRNRFDGIQVRLLFICACDAWLIFLLIFLLL
jgi:hypothetical protein